MVEEMRQISHVVHPNASRWKTGHVDAIKELAFNDL